MAKFTHYAKSLDMHERKRRLSSMDEASLRKNLLPMLTRMLAQDSTHLTHGANELGKDLVIVESRPYGLHAISLVVKAHKLVGETSKDVDEVASQTKQSFIHPAVVPDRIDPVPISEVWVVASDTISGPARTRIAREVDHRGVRFVDCSQLEEWFTEYYPEAYFQEGVLEYIDQTALALEADHISAESITQLSDMYVEPFVMASPLNADTDVLDLDRLAKDEKIRFRQLDDVLIHENSLLLVGEPGVGKSTALKKMCIDRLHVAAATATSELETTGLKLPLIIRARKLMNCADADELCRTAIPEPLHDLGLDIDLLLVDGLDEAPAERHSEILEKAKSCAAELGARLVISSRNVDTVGEAVPGFGKYEMLPFETAQAVELFKRMVTNADTLAELEEALDRIKNNLSLTPLSLVLLVRLAQEGGEIPATIGELYDRFTDEVLGKHESPKDIEVVFEYQIKKRFLAELAFVEFYSKNRLVMPLEEFETFIRNHFETYGLAVEQIGPLVRYLQRAEILRISHSVRFRHRSFLEYFCAYHVSEVEESVGDITQWAIDTYFDVDWSEVVFYYFGHKRRVPNDFLAAVFAHDVDDQLLARFFKFMVGRLLQAGWYTPVSSKVEGIRGALAYTLGVREDFISVATAIHGKTPPILADIGVLNMAERAFRSRVLSQAGVRVLNEAPTGNANEALAFVSLLWALRRNMSEDDLLRLAARYEASVSAFEDQSEKARLLMLGVWTLEDHPEAKKLFEAQYAELIDKYPDIVRGILPEPRKGWRLKGAQKPQPKKPQPKKPTRRTRASTKKGRRSH